MKKGYYIIFGTNNNLSHNTNNGVEKKIVEQVNSLNVPGMLECKLFVFKNIKTNYFFKLFIYLFSDQFKEYDLFNEKLDFVYIRRFIPVNKGLIEFVKKIKKYNPECIVLYEIPTYPYDQEHKSFKEKVVLFIDKIYRSKLKDYVDRIVTLSNDDYIFNIKTIKIINGINCKNIPLIQYKNGDKKNINLIAVAQFAFWHGYERLIKGLYLYYKNNNNNTWNVKIHFVGNGIELSKYKDLVIKYNLEKHVSFYGALHGSELDKVFNSSDIGIGSLASHRKNLYLSSELKSREYLARGLPIVVSTKIDCLPNDYKYCLYVPEDESPISIEKIIEFYCNIFQQDDNNKVIKEIREFAERNIDIKITMKPVIDYIIN